MKGLKLLKSDDGEIYIYHDKRPKFIAKVESLSPFYLVYKMWETIDFYKDRDFQKDYEKLVKEFIDEKIKYGEI
ncbi:hypothetical protein [Chryseobacterium oncorhynchi]|uniref:Uncharacterized protein n=1 Tax=Chryseobacterium oncorhynchi TaxID=741074 RepID=A0A316X127_9FLAO|nr:hypothetical protein [Chryseobacterium oncorhynchi]PWN67592.1 hypothetical protein C1638_003100 [Chryseobacterium oncorhynchi]